jgi:hypothetical protein
MFQLDRLVIVRLELIQFALRKFDILFRLIGITFGNVVLRNSAARGAPTTTSSKDTPLKSELHAKCAEALTQADAPLRRDRSTLWISLTGRQRRHSMTASRKTARVMRWYHSSCECRGRRSGPSESHRRPLPSVVWRSKDGWRHVLEFGRWYCARIREPSPDGSAR